MSSIKAIFVFRITAYDSGSLQIMEPNGNPATCTGGWNRSFVFLRLFLNGQILLQDEPSRMAAGNIQVFLKTLVVAHLIF